MKKLTAMILAFSLAISMIPQMSVKADKVTSETEVIRYNESGQNYTKWASTVDSYLSECSDGNLMRVQYISAETGIIVEYYNTGYELLSSKTVKGELPIFGGFYETDTNYYLVTGQTNREESDATEVFRITKYDKDWNRIAAAGIFGANTTIPFDAGSVRMDSYENYLLIRTCHEMYASPKDGLNHQANVTIQVNTDTMTITQYDANLSNLSIGYVSHSFNQFIQIDSGRVVSVDHGDAYPRSIVLCKYPTDISTGKYRSGGVYSDSVIAVPILTIPGQIGQNKTGASVGGFEISDSSYLVAGNSVIQDNQNLSRKTRNIFLASVPKNSNSVTLNWLTDYAEGETGVSTPHMIKIREDLYMVLWERDGNVYYKACDGQGNPGIRTYTMMDASLSECAPLVTDTKVIWYSCDSQNMVFYDIALEGFGIECSNGIHTPVRIETKEPTCIESGYQAHWECEHCGVKFTDESGSEIVFDETYYIEPKGHDYISQNIDENGISHLKCSDCGNEKEAAAITSVTCWWRQNDDTSEWYYSNFKEKQDVGAELECWVRYEPGNTEDKLRVTSSDEHIISVEELREYSGNKFVNLIMKKAGEATITISSLYNPELKEEYKITVACGDNHVWNSDFTVDKEASCTEKGSKSIHCANCNQVKDVTEIPALGHDRSSEIFSDSVSHWYECNRCFAPIDKEMHKGGNVDCENPGNCVVCGKEYLEAKGHEWEADFTVDKEASCTEKGIKSIHCATCNQVKDVTEIPALGHNLSDKLSSDAEKHWYPCERCGAKIQEALHTGGTATTTEQARCEVCGTAYGELLKKTSVADIFVDVKEEDWYKDAVQFVYDEGVMTGMNDTYFGSVNHLARAQFAMVIYRMEGAPETEFKNIFPDVKETDWYADAVIWAYENGIITGYTDTKTFGPADHITREQMATMMHRYAVYKKYDVSEKKDLSDFPDHAAVSAYAEEAMQWCVGTSIITGDGITGKLLPQGSTNRVVCATIMQRYIQQYEK